ncbi:leucine-rich repeat protein, partial [Robinsoniella peoriensis]
VIIDKNVKVIHSYAFSGAKQLKSITVKSKVLNKVYKNTFKNIHKRAVIRVPSSKLRAYKKLMANKGQSKTVVIRK